MNAMGIRSLALVATMGFSFGTNVNAAERGTKSVAKVQEEKTAFFGLPFFGGCNTGGYAGGGYGYGGGFVQPGCFVPPCNPRPCYGTPYPVGGCYPRPYPYGMPAYSNPGYAVPNYGVPSYGAPSYGVPDYGVPSYGVPGYGAPGYYGPYGMNRGAAPVSASPYLGNSPVINTSGYRSPVLPSSLDDPYFP